MKFYEKILLELKTETQTMQTLYRHAFSFADEVAFEYSHNLVIHKMTYGECRKEILRIYHFLSQRISSGRVIALIMGNSPLWVECFWAVLMSGGIIMPLSENMTDTMVRECLSNSGCTLLLGDRDAEGCESVSTRTLKAYKPEHTPETEPEAGWGDEIILSSSATTGSPQLFAYTGREICSQILNSGYVLEHCRDISRFWKGQFRQLAFLPFSHIFGLTACYLWFVIFGRTFVFLEDYTPATILRTCRLHRVTHIFAVPILWDSLARGIVSEAEKSGMSEKLEKGIKLSLKLQDLSPAIGRAVVPLLMKKVQDSTLGKSVRFCISGGGMCGAGTGRIVNGCGYHLENGYGMTEIGIACVTLEKKASRRNCRSVGRIFPSLAAQISDEKHLLVKGDSCYAARYVRGTRIARDPSLWFDTGDCFEMLPDGEMVILGRSDDIVNGSNGERISPESIETELNIGMPCCVVCLSGQELALLVEVPIEARLSLRRRESIVEEILSALGRLPLAIRPRRILYTYETIPVSLSHKYRRSHIASLLEKGELKAVESDQFISPDGKKDVSSELLTVAEEIAGFMKQVLRTDQTVGIDSDFFADLGGDSLSYIEYLNAIENKYQVEIPSEKTAGCTTPLSAAETLSRLAES